MQASPISRPVFRYVVHWFTAIIFVLNLPASKEASLPLPSRLGALWRLTVLHVSLTFRQKRAERGWVYA